MLPEFWEVRMSEGTHPATEHHIPEDWHHQLHYYENVELNQKKSLLFITCLLTQMAAVLINIAFCGLQIFPTIITRAYHRILSWAVWIQCTLLKFTLVQVLQTVSYFWLVSLKFCIYFLFSPICTKSPAHITLVHFITQIICILWRIQIMKLYP